MKALVVDNDFFFVEFLAELLERRGYEVIKAYDGKDCISKLKEEGPVDFLFVDIIMPKIDGKQLIKLVRKKYPDARFPIIAVSGIIIEQLDEIDKIGADYYIAKGSMETMADHVNEFMDIAEKQPLSATQSKDFLEPGKVYPRQITIDLIDTITFQKAITESVGLGIIVVDKDARILKVNSLALDILSKPLEEVLNYRVTAIFPANEKAKLVDTLNQINQNRELKKIRLSVAVHSRKIKIIVSLLKIEEKIAGWIIALEDTGGDL